MFKHMRMWRWLSAMLLCLPLISFAGKPVKSMVIFGDSISDIGNTTHLLKSLRKEENPAYLVTPLKAFVINKMIEYANDYYVPQMVLDAGISVVTDFFDHELAPYLADLISRVRLVPLLPGKPYWNSRFSNGRVWNEYLALMWSLPMDDVSFYENKAFGGSWAATYDYQLSVWNLIRHPLKTLKTLIVGKLIPPSFGLVVQAYLLENQNINPHAVYFLSAGANDYINALVFQNNYDPDTMKLYVNNVADSFIAGVRRLLNAGATRFVVLGVPRIGNTPRFVNTNDREILNLAIDQHNQRLQAQIEELKSQFPKADFLFIDIEQFIAKAITSPSTYGFSNITEACIDVKFPMYGALANSPFAHNFVLQYANVLQLRDSRLGANESNYHVCDTPSEYLFWDEVHPSTRAHAFLAYEICNTMQAHGYDVTCRMPEV